jgi:putative DNA methylase
MTHSLEPHFGWHSRGYLPHFDGGELAQFPTFRLHDALPQSVLVRWREELKLMNPGEAEAIMRRRVEAYLDQGHGSCYLRPKCGRDRARRVAVS